GLVGILLAAGGLGGTAVTAMGERSTMDIFDFLVAGYNFLLSVLFFTGLAALALGWAPKLGKVVYIYLAYSFELNYFCGILDLPEWFSKSAIQSFIPQMSMEYFDSSIFIIITIISIILMVIGYLGYSRRDMIEGS